MNGWDKSVVEYRETGKVQGCPFCKTTDVQVEEHKGKIRDSISFLCRKCGKSAHYDGLIKK